LLQSSVNSRASVHIFRARVRQELQQQRQAPQRLVDTVTHHRRNGLVNFFLVPVRNLAAGGSELLHELFEENNVGLRRRELERVETARYAGLERQIPATNRPDRDFHAAIFVKSNK